MTWARRPKTRLTAKITAMARITAIHTQTGTFTSTGLRCLHSTQHQRSPPPRSGTVPSGIRSAAPHVHDRRHRMTHGRHRVDDTAVDRRTLGTAPRSLGSDPASGPPVREY